MLKDILLLCDGGEGLPSVTAAAMALARKHEANLFALSLHEGVHPQTEASTRARGYFEDIAQQWRTGDWRWVDAFGAPESLLARAVSESRAHDLVLIDLPVDRVPALFLDLPGRIMNEGGRPVIVWPGDHAPSFIGRRILVLWQGRASSARALHEALPLLRHAFEIEVAIPHTLGEHEDALALSPVEHLRHHGIPALRCGTALPSMKDFDLVVMGIEPSDGLTVPGSDNSAFARLGSYRDTALFISG
jgi:hypothetical protein